MHEQPADRDPRIVRLRELCVALDRAVADADGWGDLALDHDHRETPLGLRFAVSDALRIELLDRLLELNHERAAEEIAQAAHEQPAKRVTRRSASTGQDALFDAVPGSGS